MAVKLIVDNTLTKDHFLSATEQAGPQWSLPTPATANTGFLNPLSLGTPADTEISCTATSNGSTTTAIDTNLTIYGDDLFIGGTLEVTEIGHAAQGETQTITDFDQGTGTVTVGVAFSGSIDTSDDFTITMPYSTRDFKIVLTGGGNAGTATYKWSHDGGDNYYTRYDPTSSNWLTQFNVMSGVNVVAYGSAIIEAANGNLLFFYNHGTGSLFEARCAISTDKGVSWGDSIIVAAGAVLQLDVNDVAVLETGRILVSIFRAGDDSELYYSDDHGVTWAYLMTNPGEGDWCQSFCEISRNYLVAVGGSNTIDLYVSKDGGGSWTDAVSIIDDTGNQNNPFIRQLKNGDLLIVYEDDGDSGINEIKGKISRDYGSTYDSAMDILSESGNAIENPMILVDIDGRVFVVADENTSDRKIVFTNTTDADAGAGATWASAKTLKTIASKDLARPYICLRGGHELICIYGNTTDSYLQTVRVGIWGGYGLTGWDAGTPCQLKTKKQDLIASAEIKWYGSVGIAADEWTFDSLYDYAMHNIVVADSPSESWRSTQDNAACSIVIDLGSVPRHLFDGIGIFNHNIRSMSLQMNASNSWGSPSVNRSLDPDLANGTVDAISGNAIKDTSLLANYKDYELSGYYLTMTSGTDNSLRWKILHNSGDHIYLDTTTATNISGSDTFVISKNHLADTFNASGDLYRYIRISIDSQDTAEEYYQIGSIVIGKTITLSRDWSIGYQIEHKYGIDFVRQKSGGITAHKYADKKRIFKLSWPAVTNTHDEITNILNHIEGKNLVLIPDDSDMNTCYLVKCVSDPLERHRYQNTKFDLQNIILEEVL